MNLVGGTVVAGRFRLVRELGQGGMGAVWLAQDTSLDTPCAIKFIHGQAAESAQMRQRFEREAKSAAQLRSPNVVQILDHGISDGTPYIAMELLEGEDLDHRLNRVGRLSAMETVSIMAGVSKALMRANAVGLVHRDLKPANIFLVRDEDRDIPKVLDFGVAKSSMPELADASTKTGALMGTPYYMSPEQTRGTKALDHRSDLWALAVIVFQCVTGRLPFLSESLGDLLFKIATDPLPVPSHVASDLPPSFDAWWARAAQRDPAQRFQTAREFVDALALAFGLSQGGALPASVPGSGPYGTQIHQPGRPPSGSGPSFNTPPPGWGQQTPTGGSNPGYYPPQPQIVLGPATQTGVSARSVADKGEKRSPALMIGIVGVVVVGGGIAAALAFRHPTATATTTSGTGTPAVSEPPHPSATTATTTTATATTTVPQPTVSADTTPPTTASVAATGAPDASAPKTLPTRPGTQRGIRNPPPVPVHPPAAPSPYPTPKPVPNDGI